MFGAIDCGASWRGSFGAGGYGAQRVGEKESEKSKQYKKNQFICNSSEIRTYLIAYALTMVLVVKVLTQR